jgi:hypothetical protein
MTMLTRKFKQLAELTFTVLDHALGMVSRDCPYLFVALTLKFGGQMYKWSTKMSRGSFYPTASQTFKSTSRAGQL